MSGGSIKNLLEDDKLFQEAKSEWDQTSGTTTTIITTIAIVTTKVIAKKTIWLPVVRTIYIDIYELSFIYE